MTRKFFYTFDKIIMHDGDKPVMIPITITVKVTDRMEEREWMKPGYAANKINQIGREYYGWIGARATARNITEILK